MNEPRKLPNNQITVAGETVTLRPLVLDDLIAEPELLRELGKTCYTENGEWRMDLGIVIANLPALANIIAAGCDRSQAWLGKRTIPELMLIASSLFALNLDIVSEMIPNMPAGVKLPTIEE